MFRHATILIAMAALVAASTVGASPAQHARPAVVVDATRAKVGDLVTTGTPANAGCNFPEGFGIHMVGNRTHPVQTVALETDSACNLRVKSIGSTPEDAAAVTVGNYQAELPGIPTFGLPLSDRTDCPSGGNVVHNYVWMYGYGGPDDRLTIKEGYLTFNYDGCITWIGDASGNCHTHESYWNIDNCYLAKEGSDPDKAYREGHGDYHCALSGFPCNISSPPGYYHTLAD